MIGNTVRGNVETVIAYWKRADRWSQLMLITAMSDWQVLIDQQSYC